MICRHHLTKEDYNYTFINDRLVKLDNHIKSFEVKYEDWLEDYYVINKWESL